jgi:hypothetical protein
MTKLPVFAAISDAYAFVWREQSAFLALAFPAVAGLALLMGAFGLAGHFLDLSRNFTSLRVFFFVYFVVTGGAHVFAIVAFSVAWHRVYLLGETAAPREAYRWHGRFLRFVWGYVKIFLVFMPVMYVVAKLVLPPLMTLVGSWGGQPFGSLFHLALLNWAVMFVAFGWVFARFAMVLPAAAVDAPRTLRDAWLLTEESGWRLFAAVAAATLPVSVLSFPVEYWVQAVQRHAPGLTLTSGLLSIFVGEALMFLAIALGVTALSAAYKRLSEAASPSPERPEPAA